MIHKYLNSKRKRIIKYLKRYKEDTMSLNYANNISFFGQFVFDENDEILKFQLLGTKLPDITSGIVELRRQGRQIHIPGESNDFGTIPVSFIMDENWDVYFRLLELQKKYNNELESIDAFEIIIQNNQNVNIAKFVFEDIFFTAIAGPELRTDTSETEIKFDVELAFKKWYQERL